jgi:hypothetical protein
MLMGLVVLAVPVGRELLVVLAVGLVVLAVPVGR